VAGFWRRNEGARSRPSSGSSTWRPRQRAERASAPSLHGVALLTMVSGQRPGARAAEHQEALAYSSIANAGYLLVAVLTAAPTAGELDRRVLLAAYAS